MSACRSRMHKKQQLTCDESPHNLLSIDRHRAQINVRLDLMQHVYVAFASSLAQDRTECDDGVTCTV